MTRIEILRFQLAIFIMPTWIAKILIKTLHTRAMVKEALGDTK